MKKNPDAPPRLTFDRFELDSQARRLTRDGEPVPLADRHFDVLHHLVSHAGTVVSKDALVEAGWGDVAVTDNSLEEAVSAIRRALGTGADGAPYIDTRPSTRTTVDPTRDSRGGGDRCVSSTESSWRPQSSC